MDILLSLDRFCSLSEVPSDVEGSDAFKETIDPATKEELIEIIKNDKKLAEMFIGKKVIVTSYPITSIDSIKIAYL